MTAAVSNTNTNTSLVKGLQCRECGKTYDKAPIHVCEFCFGPLEVAYDYPAIGKVLTRAKIESRPHTMWRYAELLPIDGPPAVGQATGMTPLVHGAAVGTGGQLVTVPAGGRPCYRCLFEEPPPPGVGPSCAEAGVLGPVPGVLGALAGVEASLLLRGQAPAFVGRLLQYDSTGMTLRAVSFNPNPGCAVCATDARIRALAADDYPAADCAVL